MQPPKSYAPYFFAFFFPFFSLVTHGLLLKSGVTFALTFMFLIFLGLWFMIEGLLSHYERRLVRWVIVLICSAAYIVVVTVLDNSVLHIILDFTAFKPIDFGFRAGLSAIFIIVFMESRQWAGAREKAQIERLALQTESTETQFNLLKEQVNPDFLFQCLTNLETMVGSDNPQTERYILELAEVYRQTLSKKQSSVSLSQELSLLKTYLFLMCYGRETAIRFDIEISDESLALQLPVFALQSLVDKCIKQSRFSANEPLHIRIFQKEAESITISHNYQPKAADFIIDMEYLEMRYLLEGIQNGLQIANDAAAYAITLKLF